MAEVDVPRPDLDRLEALAAHLDAQMKHKGAREVRAAIEEIRIARLRRPVRDDRPADPPLIELADGSWIDPRDVRGITPMARETSSNGEVVTDRVVVSRHHNVMNRYLPFGSLEEACDYAARLGRRVNAARAGKAEGGS